MTIEDYFSHSFHYRKNQANPFLCYGNLSTQAKIDARASIDENRLWRYMIQNYHDAIALCRVFGPPDFFVTFTCNPKWPEISEAIAFEPGQKPTDRADMVVRVYNMKLEELLDDIRNGAAFGPISAVLHTVEFQKRGLPHAHIIVWLSQDTSQPTPAFIDRFISAEIPDPDLYPLAYALVAEHMVHGPCGTGFETCPCMKKGKCSKRFPKQYQIETNVDGGGFAVYRRSDNKRYVQKGTRRLDSGWVVPYNVSLLKKFQAQINVEWCNKTIFVKYLFKYVTKGPDCGKVYIQRTKSGQNAPYDEQTKTVNEVKEYLDCRNLTYCEFPSKWKWDSSSRSWEGRQRDGGKVGRLYFVHPSAGERYFLRMLLLVVRGAQSYEDIRTFNGVLYPTFRLACCGRGLLGDDQEWYDAFDEAAAWATSSQLRKLFVTMLLFCEVNDENAFFEKVWKLMADDIQYRFREIIGNNQYQIPDVELRNHLIDDFASIFSSNGARIRDRNLPQKSNASEYNSDLDLETQKEISEFSRWVLDIGEGKIDAVRKEGETEATWIKIPRDLLLMPQEDKVSCIVDAVYPDLVTRYSDPNYLQSRAILTPTNEIADTVNSHVVSLVPGEEKEYLSCDKIGKSPGAHGSYDLLYPVEFLNSLNGNNFPQHRLLLKKGVPIMMLRNLDQAGELCNGTRLVVTGFGDMLIEAQIMTVERVCMAFDLLPALRPRQWHATICVGVCRKWDYRGGTDDGPIQHVDHVLLDEKGNIIYGEIPGNEVEAKSPLLQEDGNYVISRFRVSNAKSGYRPVDCPYMVEFTLHTTFPAARTDMPAFLKYAYKITPIHELSSHAGDTRNFLVTLRSGSLYGDRELLLSILMPSTTVLKQSRLLCCLLEGYYLSANTASRWYFNPPVPEARLFHDRRMDIAALSLLDALSRMHPGGSRHALSVASLVSQMGLATDATHAPTRRSSSNIARRIIGKPVQQVLRTVTAQNAYPPDITKIVSLRFTFAVTLTQQRYYCHQKTYQVASVITSYGQRNAAPSGPAAVDGGSSSHRPQVQAPLREGSAEDTEQMSPCRVEDTDLRSPSLESVGEPGKGTNSSTGSSARKRLLLDNDSDDQVLSLSRVLLPQPPLHSLSALAMDPTEADLSDRFTDDDERLPKVPKTIAVNRRDLFGLAARELRLTVEAEKTVRIDDDTFVTTIRVGNMLAKESYD
ncbi:unnamed protein product [Miscanthus lutarioriparius]|uniref:ATP-dependent DNA helicase n=1 Tax=Miscanthus lutarioriparius TaxID=422564 RepID=A0A811PND3_9POAL|nr:unnamed protein product [Miscanthus lutarioriparius]